MSGTTRKSERPEQRVGEAVRRLRKARLLGVRELAIKSGFSAGFISQVELGQVSPSIASLERIAAALGITLGEFFQSAASSGPFIVKKAERQVLQSKWSRARIEALGSKMGGGKLEALLVTLEPGGTSGSQLHAHETELLTVVFEGRVQLMFEDSVQSLRRGDAVVIPAGTLHRWRNASQKPTQLLKVTPRLVL